MSNKGFFCGEFHMNDARISIRLDRKLERRLREEARAVGKSESEFVRDILVDYFAALPATNQCLRCCSSRRDYWLCGRVTFRFEHQ